MEFEGEMKGVIFGVKVHRKDFFFTQNLFCFFRIIGTTNYIIYVVVFYFDWFAMDLLVFMKKSALSISSEFIMRKIVLIY